MLVDRINVGCVFINEVLDLVLHNRRRAELPTKFRKYILAYEGHPAQTIVG